MKRTILRALLSIVSAFAMTVGACYAQESAYDQVLKRGKLIAGIKFDYPPFSSMDSSGHLSGFEVDIGNYIGRKMGVPVEFKQVTSSTRIPSLLAGAIDLTLTHMNPTRERAKVIDFGMVYFKGGTSILVKKNSGIKSIKDLEAPKLTATTQGSSDGPFFLAFQPKGKLVYFQEHPQAVLALKQGKVNAVTTEVLTLQQFAKNDPELEVIEPPYKPDPAAIGLRQNDSKWRLFLDQTIMEMWKDGEYQRAHEKNLGVPVAFTIELWPDFYEK